MARALITTLCITLGIAGMGTGQSDRPVWPPPPDEPKVVYLDEIRCSGLELKSGLLGKLKRLIGGRSDEDAISLPFDVLVVGRSLYMTCQNLPGLVTVNLDEMTYRIYGCKENPLRYPIALCDGGRAGIFMTDSETAIVYRFLNGRVEPFISEGLRRPTGIAALENMKRLYVVDTGDHSLKIFNYQGDLLKTVRGQAGPEEGFNFPTFAQTMGEDMILVNDALNYNVKLFDDDGLPILSFGEEGDGPGAFSRAKGVGVDSRNNIYVVDNLFDNVQVFDKEGRLLLVIGSAGQGPGQFWSPAGIDIVNDTIYVADTFNNRIQILRFLGGQDD